MWQVDVWFKGSVQQECRGMYKLTWHICLVFVSADLTRRFLSLRAELCRWNAAKFLVRFRLVLLPFNTCGRN